MMKNSPFNQRFLLGMIAVAVCGSAAAKSLDAQQNWPFRKAANAVMDARKVNELSRNKRQAIRSSGASNEQKTDIARFYVSHVFKGMTQPAALNDAMQFPDWRKELVTDLENLRGNTALYRYLRDELAFKYLKQLVVGNYHPACRYNATLMIGMLNDQEGDRNSSTPYAKPYTPGREYLIQVARSQKLPESVRIAALIGLRRHAELLAAGGSSDATLVALLVGVARAKVPPDADADAAYWQKRLAIEGLGALGSGGAAAVLSPIVSDQNLPLSVRCAAARALGQLDYRNVSNVDPNAILKGLGSVAVSACRNEIKRVQEYNAENPEPARGNQPLFGQPDQEPEADPLVMQVRRQLKHRLNCVTQGMEGVEKIASQPDQQGTLTSIRSEIDAIQRGLDDGVETMTPEELLNKIGPPAVRLEGVVKGNA